MRSAMNGLVRVLKVGEGPTTKTTDDILDDDLAGVLAERMSVKPASIGGNENAG
jgi:hypothetical protein